MKFDVSAISAFVPLLSRLDEVFGLSFVAVGAFDDFFVAFDGV